MHNDSSLPGNKTQNMLKDKVLVRNKTSFERLQKQHFDVTLVDFFHIAILLIFMNLI